jgi:hypothetical protein
LALLILLLGSAASAQTVGWDANAEADLAGYRVQYGTSSTSLSSSVDVGNVTSYRFTNLQAGTTYYFRVVAYNTAGLVSAPSNQISYTVPSTAPTLSSVSPTSGPTSGGTVITLTGTNFVSGATVRVGGAAATGVTFVSATQVRATTPAGTAGARDVQIINPNGQSATRTGAFTYTTTSAPTLSGVSPTSGPTTGGTVITLTGTNFVSGATVRVGGASATGVTFVSATQVRATTPAGTAGARDVQIINPNGQSATRTGAFTYTTTATITLTSLSPTSGPTSGGTVITLTGTNFVSGATVRVGGVAASAVTFLSATQVRATTPAGTAGARDVQITNPNGQSATRAGAFTYTSSSSSAPTVTSLSITSGPLGGGTTTYLTGTNFQSGTSVVIGGKPATNFRYYSPTSIRVATPSNTAGPKDVRVTNPDGQSSVLVGGFTFVSGTTSSMTSGTFSSFLAEGVQTGQMTTELSIANAEETAAQVNLTFMDAAGQATEMAVEVPARSRQTVDLSTVPQLAGQTFSTRIDADQPVAVDRLMSLDAAGQSASLEAAVSEASPTWYFAEGSTIDPMELFYLVQNAGTTPASVQVRYLRPDGQPGVTKTYEVAAGSRATIWVDREDPALASAEIAAEITSLDGTPIVVERSLYLKEPGAAQPRGGDTSAGVTAPATQWFLEASTGRSRSRLLLANPGSEAAEVRATYTREDGRRVARRYTVAAGSRQTIDVAAQHPSLATAQLSIAIESTQPIVAERTTWWGANGQLDEALSGAGATSGGARWLLAEAQQGGERNAATSVVVFNRGAATDVAVTLLFEDGPEATATFPVGAGERFAVPMAEAFPAAAGRRFSVLVEGADPAASLVVERAIFWQGAGAGRTAGADGAASRLR